jgi:hypothetical protein
MWITEFGAYRYASTPPPSRPPGDERRVLAMWELGRLYNQTERRGLGGSLLLALNDNALRFGAKARYRLWLTPDTPLDIAPGVLLVQADQDLEARVAPGLTGHVGISVSDWVGAFVQGELARNGPALHVGGRLGGWPGAIAGTVLPVFALVRFGIYDRS